MNIKLPIYQIIYLVFTVIFLANYEYNGSLIILAFCLITLISFKCLTTSLRTDFVYLILSIILIILSKNAVYFIPLFAHDLSRKEDYYLTNAVYFIVIVSSEINFQAKIILFALTLTAIYLKYLETSYQTLSRRTETLMNDTESASIKLAENNKRLIESRRDEIYTSTLKERARIARELHDSIGHLLSSSIIQLGAIKQLNQNETLKPLLANLDHTLNTGITETRLSIHNLHSEAINLEYEIDKIIENYSFCPISFFYQIDMKLPSKLKYSVIYIIKEALSNTAKHSNASSVKLSVKEFPSFIQLIIHDNGNSSGNSEAGIGLTSIQERVSEFSGNLTINKSDGFEIRITINKEQIH